MNKLLLTTLCLQALAGCSGNQQTLEDCMTKAARRFDYVGGSVSTPEGCAKQGLTPDACRQAEALTKQTRLEDEDRCVKLYK